MSSPKIMGVLGQLYIANTVTALNNSYMSVEQHPGNCNAGELNNQLYLCVEEGEHTKAHSDSYLTFPSDESDRSSQGSERDIHSKSLAELQLAEEAERVGELLKMEKDKNDILLREIAILTKQLNSKTTHLNTMAIEKQKIRDDLQYVKEGYEKVQEERNRLVMETGHMRNQINNLQATFFVQSQQIEILENSNAKLIDELNYEKEIVADFKNQNAMFKGHLRNIVTAFLSLKETLVIQQQSTFAEAKQAIDLRLKDLMNSSWQLKDELMNIQSKQKELKCYKNTLFAFSTDIEQMNTNLRTQLNCSRSLSGGLADQGNISALLAAREEEYRKIFSEHQQQMSALTLQIVNLRKHNAELMDELSSNPHAQGRRAHTNTEYISRILKEHQRELNQIHELMEAKESELIRLKQQLQLQASSSKAKSEEIERLSISLSVEQNNRYTDLTLQIDELSAQKVRLGRRIDSLTQNLSALKNQIGEKDRIIMTYVQNNKIQ